MANESWEERFKAVFEAGVTAYRAGRREAEEMFDRRQTAFLASIGCTPQELFDFVEDHCDLGEPSFDDTLAVAAVRRRFFEEVQHGIPSQFQIDPAELPPKDEAVEGIRWLPRIIAKARAKLRGELDPGTMYGCGGDRPFLQSVNLTLPGFLELVWSAGADDSRIIRAVKQSAGR